MMPIRLISPNLRRIVTTGPYTVATLTQLRSMGWVDYAGPATVTPGHTRATAGWVVPGSDPELDKARFAKTGLHSLGRTEPTKP